MMGKIICFQSITFLFVTLLFHSVSVSSQTTTNAVSPTTVATSVSPSPSPSTVAITTVVTTVVPTTVSSTTTSSRDVSSSSSSSAAITTALTTIDTSSLTTTTSSSPTASASPTGNTGIPASTMRIVYGVLGAVGGIAVLGGAFLIWNCYRKKAEDAEYLAEHKMGPVPVGPNHITSTPLPLHDRPPQQPQMAYYDDRSAVGHGDVAGSVYMGSQYGDHQSQYEQYDHFGGQYSDQKVPAYPPEPRYSDPKVQTYPPDPRYDQKSGFVPVLPILPVSDPHGNNQFVDSSDVSDNQYVSAPRNQPGYIHPTIPVPSPYVQPVQAPYYDYPPQQYSQGYGQQPPQQNYGYRN
ncbi:hypothetical protein HK096_001216 [Nowakowskiella sp. JEL0078]|nr:hypothetical protein HK096_001216 [Nowakowskiella sp. JEL0078]